MTGQGSGDRLARGATKASFPASEAGVTQEQWAEASIGATGFRCAHADERGQKLYFDTNGDIYCRNCWDERKKQQA